MYLQTNTKLKMIKNHGVIPEEAICYGNLTDGTVGWAKVKSLAGQKWNKYSLGSPSIIMVDPAVFRTTKYKIKG